MKKKYIVKYTFFENKYTPNFIEDGGYFFNNNEVVGVTKEILKEELKKEECCKQIFTKTTFSNFLKTLNLKDENGNEINIKKITDDIFKRGI